MTYRFGLVETYFMVLSALLVAVALLAFNKRPKIIARSTAFTLATLAILTAGYGFVLAAVGLKAKSAWYGLQVVGICSLSTGWMLLSLAYTRHARYVTRRNVTLLSIVPALILLLAWTNRYHELFLGPWKEVSYGGVTAIVADAHVGYHVISLYTMTVTPVGVFILARELPRATARRRRLLIALLLAGIAPYFVEVVFILGYNPIWPLDTTSFAFTVTGVAFAYVFFRRQSMELVPFALDAAVDELSEGLMVVDTEGRVIYVNDAARRILDRPAREIIEGEAGDILRVVLDRSGVAGQYYDVKTTELAGKRGRARGQLVLIRDVSTIKQAELTLMTANERLEERIAERTARLTEINRQLAEEVGVREEAERRARLLAREVVSAQEEERRRIARDLHDEAGQLLTALKLWLSMLAEDEAESGVASGGQLDQIKRLSDSAIDSIRRVVWELRPPTLDSAGVDATLGWLCAEYERQGQLRIEYKGIQVPGCPESMGITLYRCLQESLNNVIKHARASHVSVELKTVSGQVLLTVEDDGCGFTGPLEAFPQEMGQGGMGISGMAERAEAQGGQLEIASAASGGTRVTVTLPDVDG